MIEIAVDLGGTFTRIYEKTSGLILEEPTLVAVEKYEESYEIIAFGNDAKKLQGKSNENVVVFSPITEGIVKAIEYAGEMLKFFLQKNYTKRQIKDMSAILIIPCGISPEEREKFRSVAYFAGIKKADIVPKSICSAYSMDLDIDGEESFFVVGIGGQTTEVCAIANNSIIEGSTTVLAGSFIDKKIAEQIENEGLIISLPVARKLKEEIATLSEQQNLRYDIVGLDSKTKTPRTNIVSTTNIRRTIEPALEEIIKIIQTTANICPPEVASDIVKNGIFVYGGTSSLPELERFLRKNLGVAVCIGDNFGRSGILGAGKLLQNKDLLNKVIDNF